MTSIIDTKQIESFIAPAFVPGSIKPTMKAFGATKRDWYLIERQHITITTHYNVRFERPRRQAHIRWLADQMKLVGYDHSYPLKILITEEPDGSVNARVTDGHCRVEAYDLAVSEGAELGMLSILVSKEHQDSAIDEISATMISANGSLALEDCEIAVIVHRQARYGWDLDKIATRFGMSKAQIKNYLTMMRMHPSVREAWFAGQVSMNVILALNKSDPHNIETEIKRLIDEATANAASASDPASGGAEAKQLDAFEADKPHDESIAKGPAAPTVPKVKLSQLPGRKYALAVKHVAPRMHTVLSRITEHKDALSMLPEELRNDIEALISEVLKKAAGDKPADAAAVGSDTSDDKESISHPATAKASAAGKVVALQRVA